MESLWTMTAPPIPGDEGAPPSDSEVVIAGAGLTGLALARLLADTGIRVTVLEARSVGAVTTGNTTGKLSLLQGDVFSGIRSHAGERALRAYAEANRAGQRWLLDELADVAGAVHTADAVTYATTDAGVEAIGRELEAAGIAGVPASRLTSADLPGLRLPFEPAAALRLADQAQLQPMRALGALTERVRAAGIRVVTGCRVTGADVGEQGVRVQTERGTIACGHLVLATGTPILDRGLFFAKLAPSRSFVVAYEVGESTTLPDGMFLSVDDPSRSLRVDRFADGSPALVVGGGAHVPGRTDPTSALLAELDEWTARHWPDARRRTWWAAQDYRSVRHLPFAGPLPRGGGRILTATGYAKWGMSNAPAAALELAGILRDRPVPWAEELSAHRPTLSEVGESVQLNAAVGGHLVADWVKAGVRSAPDEPPAEGRGRVRRSGMSPVAESTVGGVARRVTGVCTHLGGIVTWNDAECTWDCPLHGSRFAAGGEVLEGPAVEPLAPTGE